MATSEIGLNKVFPIYTGEGEPFNGLVLRKAVVDGIVMSLGDKITGDVYYKDNALNVTMREYVVYNDVRYYIVNPPTIVREGMVGDNSELKGMTKYSFEFYHPMYMLASFPFTDVAVTSSEERYLSQNKTFSWIGKPQDYIDKLNKNLQGTQWIVAKSDRFPKEKDDVLSEVLSFDNNTVADALKTGHDTWDLPFVISLIKPTDKYYSQGKRFLVEYGLPSNEIYASEQDRQMNKPFVFKFGQGVGLKNNSRTPRNNKIITRIAGYGSEDNIPYGYPQIVWEGSQDATQTQDGYPIYDGIVGGRNVKLIKHPFTRTHLMPSIYTETVNKKVNQYTSGYNPNIEIKDYYDAVRTSAYPYVNEINPDAPCYESHEFEDIKPELDSEGTIAILGAVPINNDLTTADKWDDAIDDDGNYIQSYFKVTLPVLSFDLYACAAITQEMQINMRSGACIGCTFPVQVDWDEYRANFYDKDGNFAPDGTQRDLDKYPKSNQRSIDIILQKEYSTFGTIMPNIYQQPKSGDNFVILGISLPIEYITNAEKRLDDAMKSYMLENNVYYFDYPLKFDEYFFATHTNILEQIHPNTVVRFEYAGEELQLFVKQMTVKYENKPLPTYDITLTDNIEVVLNQIGQVAEDVERLSSLIAILRQSYNRNVWLELAKKLSKVNDDTAQGFITFIKGLQVGNKFTSGILGEGGVFRKDADGKTYIEADKMYIRMKAYFDNVEIRDYQHTSGNRIVSLAKGFTASRVEWYDNNGEILSQEEHDIIDEQGNVTGHYTPNPNNAAKFRLYWRAKDDEHEAENQFVVGDLAFSQYADVTNSSLVTKRYWRLVVGRNTSLTEDGEAWIDLSNRATDTIQYVDYGHVSRSLTTKGYEDGSEIPTAEDDVCQLGNVWATDRQGAIIEYAGGEDAPSYHIYQDIGSDIENPYSLNGKNYISFGYNSGTGRAFLNVFGDTYIGAKPDEEGNAASYIRFNSEKKSIDIKANLNIESTVGDSTLSEYITNIIGDSEDIYKFIESIIGGSLEDIQKQIDGVIETWFQDGVPTLNNYPASEWVTENDKEKHSGDLYYDNTTGTAYRFSKDENGNWFWNVITDEAITKALAAAKNAQDTADGKRRVFVDTPKPPYDAGDLWVNANYDTKYKGDILRCVTSKKKDGFFDIDDWTLASDYIDKTDLDAWAEEFNKTVIDEIKNQVDGKAETWYQSADPSMNWNTDEKKEHIGDLWYCTADINDTFKKDTTWYWDGTKWQPQNVPQEVFDRIDGKAEIFVNEDPHPYHERDLWFLPKKYTLYGGKEYETGTLVVALQDSETFNPNHWTKRDNYTDGSETEYLREALKDALKESTTISGGLILSSLIQLGMTTDEGYKVMSGISGIVTETLKERSIAAWYGGNMIDHEAEPGKADYAQSLFRFDGSGYLSGGKIKWNADGSGSLADSAIWWTTAGALHLSSGIIIGDNSDQPSTVIRTLQSILNFANNLANILTPVDSNYNPISWEDAFDEKRIFALKVQKGFYSEQWISALGANPNTGGGGGGVSYLSELLDVSVGSAVSGQALVYNGSKWVASTVQQGLDTAQLASYLVQNGYAKTADVTKTLTIQRNGTNVATYSGTAVVTANISVPTNTNELTNGAGFITTDASITGNAGSASKLADNAAKTAWGQTFFSNGVPQSISGNMTGVGSITASSYVQANSIEIYHGTPYIDFHFNSSTADFTSRIIEESSGVLTLKNAIKIGYASAPTIEWDNANSAYRINGNIYATGWISALGASAGGGASYLSDLLDVSVGSAVSGQALVYNGSKWVAQTISASDCVKKIGDTMTGDLTFNGNVGVVFSAANTDYVLKISTGERLAYGAQVARGMNVGNLLISNSWADYTKVPTNGLYVKGAAILDGTLSVSSSTTINSTLEVKGWASFHAPISHVDSTWTIYPDGSANFEKDVTIERLSLGDPNNHNIGLGNLTNVTITSPSNGQVLTYNGTQWVNAAASGVSGNYVTLDTAQTISGKKTFSGGIAITSGQENTSMPFFLGIEEFAKGGTVYWLTASKVCAAIGAVTTSTANASFVTALGTSGNYLAWTKNGVTNNITVPYATSAGNADTVDGLHANQFVYTFNAVDCNASTNDGNYIGMSTSSGITTDWWHILSMNWGGGTNINNKTWMSQLALPTQGRNGLYYRSGTTAWVKVVDANNIGSYSVGSATQLANTRTIWGQNFNGTQNVSGNMTGVGSITASGQITTTDRLSVGYNTSRRTTGRAELSLISSSDNPCDLMLGANSSLKWGISARHSAESYLFGVYNFTNNAFRLVIKEDGSVGIGANTPSHKLHVEGTTYSSGGIIFSAKNADLRLLGTDAGDMLCLGNIASQKMGVGGLLISNYWSDASKVPTNGLYVKGAAILDGTLSVSSSTTINSTLEVKGWASFHAPISHVDNTWTIYPDGSAYFEGDVEADAFRNNSDIRLKNIIRSVDINIYDIASAPSVSFIWKKNNKVSTGSIAQYWQCLLPELVTAGNDGYLSMQYGNIALVSAINIARKVVNHEERIKALEKENKELKEKLAVLLPKDKE